ncbi:unnamed protein product [Symbiodinium microadriaticum]|nr:unnamed protein product [Symbiodinium microadriaticum]
MQVRPHSRSSHILQLSLCCRQPPNLHASELSAYDAFKRSACHCVAGTDGARSFCDGGAWQKQSRVGGFCAANKEQETAGTHRSRFDESACGVRLTAAQDAFRKRNRRGAYDGMSQWISKSHGNLHHVELRIQAQRQSGPGRANKVEGATRLESVGDGLALRIEGRKHFCGLSGCSAEAKRVKGVQVDTIRGDGAGREHAEHAEQGLGVSRGSESFKNTGSSHGSGLELACRRVLLPAWKVFSVFWALDSSLLEGPSRRGPAVACLEDETTLETFQTACWVTGQLEGYSGTLLQVLPSKPTRPARQAPAPQAETPLIVPKLSTELRNLNREQRNKELRQATAHAAIPVSSGNWIDASGAPSKHCPGKQREAQQELGTYYSCRSVDRQCRTEAIREGAEAVRDSSPVLQESWGVQGAVVHLALCSLDIASPLDTDGTSTANCLDPMLALLAAAHGCSVAVRKQLRRCKDSEPLGTAVSGQPSSMRTGSFAFFGIDARAQTVLHERLACDVELLMKASGPISDIGCDIRRFLSAMVSTPSGAWPLPHPRSRRACNSQPALRLVDAGDAEDEDCIGTAALQHKGAPSTADRCKLQSVLGLQPALTRPAIGLPSRSGCCSGTNGGAAERLRKEEQAKSPRFDDVGKIWILARRQSLRVFDRKPDPSDLQKILVGQDSRSSPPADSGVSRLLIKCSMNSSVSRSNTRSRGLAG